MAQGKLKLNDADQAVVRMYGQGFGDCFLLAFPRQKSNGKPDPANPVYVVIDSGLFFRTPEEKERMRQVTASLKAATGGVIDLLVATHEHYDHLSGFHLARDEWKKIVVRRVWVGWTEDATHPATQKYDHEKKLLARQAEAALRLVEDRAQAEPALAAGLLKALAGFAGDDLTAEELAALAADGGAALGAAGGAAVLHKGPKDLSKTPQLVLFDLANNPGGRFKAGPAPTETDFCQPGQVRAVPETGVDAYVLGPPTAETFLGLDLRESEVYADDDEAAGAALSLEARLALAVASGRAERLSLGSALEQHHARLAAADATAGQNLDENAPFRPSLSLSYAEASQDSFFKAHYFEADKTRQIENDWLRSAGALALQLDHLTNNTSLVLAFRLPDPDGRVLLFVGDAQVGNWLSWHEIEPKDWRRPDGSPVDYRPTATDLLAHTAVYKVGHHGSHNATLKDKGLEQMPDGLIAFVPSSRKIPQQDNKRPWRIPLDTLMARLQEKSGGRVILPHHEAQYPLSAAFAGQVEEADDMLPAMERDDDDGNLQVIEEAVPLWRQVRL